MNLGTQEVHQEKSKHQEIEDKMGAGSNTSKEADALGKIITPQPTKTKMSLKFESVWKPNYLVPFSKQKPNK